MLVEIDRISIIIFKILKYLECIIHLLKINGFFVFKCERMCDIVEG